MHFTLEAAVAGRPIPAPLPVPCAPGWFSFAWGKPSRLRPKRQPLGDPTLQLYDENGVLVVANDNWRDSQEAAIGVSGLAPFKAAEPAIVADLFAMNYTAVVRGKHDTAGVADRDLSLDQAGHWVAVMTASSVAVRTPDYLGPWLRRQGGVGRTRDR